MGLCRPGLLFLRAGGGSCTFFFSFIFNWRIIALQCSVGFCRTSMWISHRYTYVLGKAMAPHSSTLPWKIPWMEEPGRLQSMGSLIQTRLSDFTFTFPFHALEKEMATHSSVLAWRVPGTGEPGRLPSMGSHRVGHNWSDLAIAIAITW